MSLIKLTPNHVLDVEFFTDNLNKRNYYQTKFLGLNLITRLSH